jgi:hypothetical protein
VIEHHVLVAINAVADALGPGNVELRKEGVEEGRRVAGEYADADAWHPVQKWRGIDAR